MAKHKTRVVIASVGGTMFALGIGALGLRLSQWSSSHHGELTTTAVISFVVAGVATAAWLLTKDDTAVPEPRAVTSTNSGVQTGRDNWGHQFNGPVGTLILGDSNTALSQPESSVSSALRETVSLELTLEIRGVLYDSRYCAWTKSTGTASDHGNARLALIAWFTNPVSSKNTRGTIAAGITAHLRFSGALVSEQVAQAYWMGRSENQIDLRSGNKAGVVVGMIEWNNWVCYWNPYERPANENFLQPALRRLGDRCSMSKSPMTVYVSLISSDSTTIETREIDLIFYNGSFEAMERT